MATKKKRTSKARKKSARVRSTTTKASDRFAVAKRAFPKWDVVSRSASDVRSVHADATTPDIAQLQKKYAKATGKAARADVAKKPLPPDSRSGLVTMRPKTGEDSRGKSIAVYVDQGKVKGIQG
jgi:hypothetical protein